MSRPAGARILVALSVVFAVFTVLASGCRRPSDSSRTPQDARAPRDLAIPPVYPLTEGAPDPLTQKLCDALYTVPATRRADCCQSKPSPTIAADCLRALGAAVRANAVSLQPSEIEACAAAIQKSYEGCDWVGPLTPPKRRITRVVSSTRSW